ncbi:GNAT family N-acetyltransferase [Treponema putidum]|uniref:GNAT family N-acetyltransferase n=1 Tax=Treponema putidum TaxID=221027 RepID=UPI003D8E7198
MSIKSISLTDKIISQKEVKDFLQKANLNQKGNLIGLFDKEKIIGAGCLYINSFHPYRDYINIYVDKDYTNKGLGSRLLEKLKEKSDKKRFQVMCSSDKEELIQFLLKEGFVLARRSYNFDLKKEAQNIFLSKETSGEFKNMKIKSLINLNSAEKEEFKKIFYFNYADTHKSINPLNKNIDIKEFSNEILADCDQEKSSCLIFNNEVSAYVIVYMENLPEIGYLGGRTVEEIEIYLNYFQVIINNLLTSYKQIYFEIDDTDYYAFPLMTALQINCKESYNTYILD